MKNLLMSVIVALCGLGLAALDVQAKRLGGGTTSGMQRQAPPRQAPNLAPTQQAAPAAPGATPAPSTVPGGRSWLGPVAGLAAGLGLAALMSHFGLGAEFANVIMLALIAAAAALVLRWLVHRIGLGAPQVPGQREFQPAGPGLDMRSASAPPAEAAPGGGGGPAVLAAIPAVPPDFDSAAFERIAKLIFIRLQAANDKADLDDLRQFATPEMFAVFKLDLQDRGNAPQRTDVVQLAAEVVDFAQEATRQIVSVRFHGLIREVEDGAATPFDEVWHLVKPLDASREWAIAGITQAG